MRVASTWVLSTWGVWLTMSGSAPAQDDPQSRRHADPTATSSRHTDATVRSDTSLEVGFGGTHAGPIPGVDVSVFGVVPTLRSRFRLSDTWELQAAWSFPYGSRTIESPLRDDVATTVMPGNPFLGAWHVIPTTSGVLRLGFGLAVPIAEASSPLETTTLLTASAAHGFFETWLWENETLSVVMSCDYSGNAQDRLRVSARADLATLTSTGSRSGATTLFAQWAVGLAYVDGATQIGLRLLSAWFPSQDVFQLSLRPFLEYAMRSFYLRAALHLNLDEPLGFAFDEGRYWGLLLTAGLHH